MADGWAVSIDVNGETVLTIGHNHLSGADDIDRHADVVRNCAQHLLAFIGGDERPTPSPMVTEEEIARVLAEHIVVSDSTLKAAGGVACVDGIADAASVVFALFQPPTP